MSSLTNDLRKYRFKTSKSATAAQNTSSSSNNGSPSPVKASTATGRKRIRMMSDSSDDNSNGAVTLISTKTKPTTSSAECDSSTLSVPEKESRLIFLKKQFNDIETMKLQDALFIAKWNIEDAMKLIKSDNFEEARREMAYSQPTKVTTSPATSTNGYSNVSRTPKLTQV